MASKQTLFGKGIESLLTQDQPRDSSLVVPKLPLEIHPKILDGLNKLEQAMIAKISTSQVTYPDGRVQYHTLEYEVVQGLRTERNSPLLELTLQYLYLHPTETFDEINKALASDHSFRKKSYLELCSLYDSPFSTTEFDYLRTLFSEHARLEKEAHQNIRRNLVEENYANQDEKRQWRRIMISPRFYQRASIPAGAIPYLNAVLEITQDNPDKFSSSEWNCSEELVHQYDGFGDLQRLVLDTLDKLGTFNDPHFSDIKTKSIGALSDLCGDEAADFINGHQNDLDVYARGMESILGYLDRISPDDYNKLLTALQRDTEFIAALRRKSDIQGVQTLKERLGIQ